MPGEKSMFLAEVMWLSSGREHDSFSLQCLHKRLKNIVRKMVVMLVQKSSLATIGILGGG